MIKFIGKLIKWVFIVVIGFGVLSYLFDDGKPDCLSENHNLLTTMAKDEVEKLAKYEVVSSSGGYLSTEIIKNDTIKKIFVTLKAKNGFNSTTSNSFYVRYIIRGCDFGLLDVKKM